MDTERKRITIAIAAMGGQGGGVLGDWLIGIAESNGYYAQSTSVPGVAQRTGATIYYLELYPEADIDVTPVMALMPVPGDVDVVIAAELIEAGRAVQRGIVTKDRTTLIASSHRQYTYQEKSAMADGRIDPTRLVDELEGTAKRLICFDLQSMAEQHGTVISATLLGALAGSGVLPFERQMFEQAISDGGKAIDANLAAFAAAYERANESSITTEDTGQAESDSDITDVGKGSHHYPAPVEAVVSTALTRLVDYQDIDYANVYRERLNRLHQLDSRHGGDASQWALSSAVAKHLALWMSYEDTIRVADLKIRQQRFERSREEVKASENEIVYLTEFMHPRIEEVADTLPASLGRWLLASESMKSMLNRFVLRERKVSTAKLSGFLLLYAIASMRKIRRGTLRYETEQQRITEWLERIEKIAIDNYELAVEITRCQNLVKGYGDTHERGLKNFNRIMDHIDHNPDTAAKIVERMRNAALADEFGNELTNVLKEVA